LQSDLEEKDEALQRLNVENSKLLKFRKQYEKLTDENRKMKGVQKNLRDKDECLKELQEKHDKLSKSYENMKAKHTSVSSKLKGMELMLDKEKATKYELKGRLSRADQDTKLQHE